MIVYGQTPPSGATIGGKAIGLRRLQNLGMNVPDFLTIAAETFDTALRDLPADTDLISLRREYLLKMTLPEADKTAIETILANWDFPVRAVVVRSSVADEDGAANAFPGLMDSFLNLTTLPDLYDAIARCAASACSERAMAYRAQKNLTMAPRPAVIIQQQITPVASGVLFTTFPDFPQEMAVHALFGFGEGLMTAGLDADEFYWLKQTGTLHRTKTARKTEQLVAHTRPGLQSELLSPGKQEINCLSINQLAKLFQIGTALEKDFGHPQDAEFVATENELFVVQSRPVTQPIPEVIVYDNSNIQESYCGVTTPLTFSFASRAYATVYRQTMQTLGLPPAIIAANEPVVTNLLGLVKGRIYYHINNWYCGLQLLPSFSQNKADMERMMGLTEPVEFVQDTTKSPGQKLIMLPGLLVNLSRLLWAFSQLSNRVSAFHEHFQKHYRRFYKQDLSTLSNANLSTHKLLLDSELLQNWSTPIINDFYLMMTNGSVVRKLKKAGITAPDEFLSRYLSGDKQVESTQPVRAMMALAAQVHTQPDLRTLILANPPDLPAQVRTRFPDFHQSVSTFIDQYGDRTVGELKLETITMRLNPGVFYQYLTNYLTADSLPSLNAGATNLHTAATDELTRLLTTKSVFFRRSIWRKLGQLQQAIRYRESLRLERTRLFGMYRALYLAMGNNLLISNSLLNKRDIFFLTETEILEASNVPDSSALADLVATRKREFARYETDDVPSRVTVPSPPVSAPPVGPDPGGVWRGTGCVPGIVTGELIVITDPRDALDVTGKIICALRTDPGWAVLFPTCRAVLIEKGSSLSHSVILLRELGIPTIINVPGLTKTVRSGQRVTINGSTGTIDLHYDPA